jgi:hypothetical protein
VFAEAASSLAPEVIGFGNVAMIGLPVRFLMSLPASGNASRWLATGHHPLCRRWNHTTLLRSLGILICKRQVLRLLIKGQNDFLTEARDTLRAGLSSAAWITVDDTGARHKATNGFCTQIGNAHFAWFGTTGSKSRLNFLAKARTTFSPRLATHCVPGFRAPPGLSSRTISSLNSAG